MAFLVCVETRKTGVVRFFTYRDAITITANREDAMPVSDALAKDVALHLGGMFPPSHYRVLVMDETASALETPTAETSLSDMLPDHFTHRRVAKQITRFYRLPVDTQETVDSE